MRLEGSGNAADGAALREQLRHVYWIGGGSGAGKSTIATRMAARHDMCLHLTDDLMSDHARQTSPEDDPFLSEFVAMDMDQRWVNRTPETMLETFHWFQGGEVTPSGSSRRTRPDGIRASLRLPREPGVIVEGFRLLPPEDW